MLFKDIPKNIHIHFFEYIYIDKCLEVKIFLYCITNRRRINFFCERKKNQEKNKKKQSKHFFYIRKEERKKIKHNKKAKTKLY